MARTMNKILLLVMLFLSTTCTTTATTTTVTFPYIDPELRPYLVQFQKEATKRGKVVDVGEIGVLAYAELGTKFAGFCNGNLGVMRKLGMPAGTSLIYIDDRYKNKKLHNYVFTALVYHELGHCLLRLDHDDKSYRTIMSESPIPRKGPEWDEWNKFYKQNWQLVLTDLFTRPPLASPPKELRIK